MMTLKNHFGLVMSMFVALFLSICMAATAIFWDKLDFSIELLIRNWGTAFLTIILTTLLIPCKALGDRLAMKTGVKQQTVLFGMLSNIVPTFFYNTAATLVLVGVNVGFTAPYYWEAVLNDYFVMFGVSYLLSLVTERIAFRIAIKCCGRLPYEKIGE